MAQYSPDAGGLAIGNYTASYDRSAFFPVAAVDLTIQSVEVYLDAGVSNRVAVYAAPLSSTTENATRLYDFGVVTNSGGAAAFITANTVGTITVPEGTYPVIVVRQGASIAICGDGAFPHGDALAAYRAYNGEVPITTPFPNPAFDDDAADQSFRIPYVRLNYTEASIGPAIVSINSGSIESGSAGNTMVLSNFASPATSLTVGGLAMTAVTNTSGDSYTFSDPGFIDGEVDPGFGTLSAVASNTVETSAGFNVTRTLDTDLTAVVLSTLSDDPETIAIKAAAQGLTIAATDTLYHGDGLTIYDDGTISDAEDGDHLVWHRDEATDVMTLIIVTIGAGVVIGVGITMRALTASALTMRNLTMRSL